MQTPTFSLLPAAALVVALFGLAACDGPREQATVGQKIDSAVAKIDQKTESTLAKIEQKTEQAVSVLKKDVDTAQVAGGTVLDTAAMKVKDATITTSVNAVLARDAALSALKINVDTSAGRVALRGTAPDAAARERATQLAQRVDGVVGVDNQLKVRSN